MQKASKHLLVGSIEAFSGKSAAILGLSLSLKSKGYRLAYAKPVSTCTDDSASEGLDIDVQFIAETLDLSPEQIYPTLLSINPHTIHRKIQGDDVTDYQANLHQLQKQDDVDLVILEGPGSLTEGYLFGLSLLQMANAVAAEIVLVSRFHSLTVIDALLHAKSLLGDHLVGVVFNDVNVEQQQLLAEAVPLLEREQIPVLGILPSNALLKSVSVSELVPQLKAEVLCGHEFLNLMVEELTIGAMNVNSALKYFRQGRNMAVVTGSDRTDLQLAALESSTHCLILTGHFPPNELVLSRSKDLEIPVLLVDSDTLATVEIIERAFKRAQVHERIKVECMQEMIDQYCDVDRLLATLGLSISVSL